MDENRDFDLDTLVDELSARFEDMMEDLLTDQLENAAYRAVQDAVPEALKEGLSDFEFVLTDGTIVRPRQHMKIFSPDKAKLLLCYGGLRVDGCTLIVQTAISRWESIASYQSREEAMEALLKVKNAMESELPALEL